VRNRTEPTLFDKERGAGHKITNFLDVPIGKEKPPIEVILGRALYALRKKRSWVIQIFYASTLGNVALY
jgi:hypothetical protein